MMSICKSTVILKRIIKAFHFIRHTLLFLVMIIDGSLGFHNDDAREDAQKGHYHHQEVQWHHFCPIIVQRKHRSPDAVGVGVS